MKWYKQSKEKEVNWKDIKTACNELADSIKRLKKSIDDKYEIGVLDVNTEIQGLAQDLKQVVKKELGR